MARPRLDALTGLRIVGSMHVAMAHLPHLQNDPSISLSLRRCFISHGMGVPFFFLLSGFVLTYRYHEEFSQPTLKSIGKYYYARLARIWPVHLFTLALAIPLAMNPAYTLRLDTAIMNVFLVQSWFPFQIQSQSYNGITWTLSIEIFFYLTLPLLLWIFGRIRATPLVLILMIPPLWIVPAIQSVYLSNYASDWSTYKVAVCPLVRLGEFLIGMLMALAFLRSGPKEQKATTRRETIEWTIVEAAALYLVGTMVFFSYRVPLYLRLNGYYTISLAILIMVFARQKGHISAFFASPVPTYLGQISFPFFMVHSIVFVCLDRLVPTGLGSWERAILYLQTAAIVAVVIHYAVEAPLGSLLMDRSKRRREKAVEVPTTATTQRPEPVVSEIGA